LNDGALAKETPAKSDTWNMPTHEDFPWERDRRRREQLASEAEKRGRVCYDGTAGVTWGREALERDWPLRRGRGWRRNGGFRTRFGFGLMLGVAAGAVLALTVVWHVV
jgi:hypothetical protein